MTAWFGAGLLRLLLAGSDSERLFNLAGDVDRAWASPGAPFDGRGDSRTDWAAGSGDPAVRVAGSTGIPCCSSACATCDGKFASGTGDDRDDSGGPGNG